MATQRKKKSKKQNTDLIVKKAYTAPHLKPHHFKPGNSANPAGRPKGSRNKLGEAFLSELLADFEMSGTLAIQDCRKSDPSTYCRIIASLLPKDLNVNDEERLLEKFLEEFTTVEEIREFRKQLGWLTPQHSAGKEGDKTVSGGKSNGVHQVLLPRT